MSKVKNLEVLILGKKDKIGKKFAWFWQQRICRKYEMSACLPQFDDENRFMSLRQVRSERLQVRMGQGRCCMIQTMKKRKFIAKTDAKLHRIQKICSNNMSF